ncbi:MAG: pentapeptide repeat-containing protein [Myxococcales bacterium]|nr:pentapeptide repeat-containing protein [Myxococcales bacterium]
MSDLLSTALTHMQREEFLQSYYPGVSPSAMSGGGVVKALHEHAAIDDVLFELLADVCAARVHDVFELHRLWKEQDVFGDSSPPGSRGRMSIRVDSANTEFSREQLGAITMLLRNITRDYTLTVEQFPPRGPWMHVTTSSKAREHLKRMFMAKQLRFLGDFKVVEAMIPADSVYEFVRHGPAGGGADLRFAGLRDGALVGVRVVSASLEHADMRRAMAFGMAVVDSSMRCACLRGADLTKAKLRDTDLSGADMLMTNLASADLSGSKLRMANLARANLRDAVLTDVALDGAHLHETIVSEPSAELFTRRQLQGAIIVA